MASLFMMAMRDGVDALRDRADRVEHELIERFGEGPAADLAGDETRSRIKSWRVSADVLDAVISYRSKESG